MSKSRPAKRGVKVAEPLMASQSVRETIESIVIAIILAFLFRAFEAEAFVIPTGSMAPTLQGRHLDVKCKECGHWYQAGASAENADSSRPQWFVATTCPLCRYTMTLDRPNAEPNNPIYNAGDPNQASFNGDRILVNKFAYDLADPHRWDVIVFKYPGNAKQNYIKRLVGLPEEVIRIRHGNVYVLPLSELKDEELLFLRDTSLSEDERRHFANNIPLERFHITRKQPHKIKATLQLVADSAHVAPTLIKAGWPDRWQPWSPSGDKEFDITVSDDRNLYAINADDEEAWIRYRHIVPQISWGGTPSDWWTINHPADGSLHDIDERKGQLIGDFYAYNAALPGYPGNYAPTNDYSNTNFTRDFNMLSSQMGFHWVGDLAVECQTTIKSATGELVLDLVKGGVHYQCRIDISTGQATLSIDGGEVQFENDTTAVTHPQGPTSVRGAGTYRLRFANTDDQVTLWVNDRPIGFDGPTTYYADEDLRPEWTAEDPYDLAPLGVGVKNASAEFTNLRVLRDVYYVANDNERGTALDYATNISLDYSGGVSREMGLAMEIHSTFLKPESWADSELFDPGGRVSITFWTEKDQFFPMGDNSPASKDARMWYPYEWYVRRDLLTGKALLVYWPHHWRRPIPFQPNFSRMGLIR